MDIAEFRRKLLAKGHGPGAKWLKADFHVHLPTSHDYEYRAADSFELLGKALEDARISFVIVLKHESFATKTELAQLQQYCPSVTLIPGAEINVIVDALFKKIGKEYFCHCIVAVDPDDPDEYGFVLRAARDKLQYRDSAYPAGFRSSIVDVANYFREAGAIFIPAHLHQSKSADTSRSIDDLYNDDAFLGFIADGIFDALEVRELATAKFFDGSHKTQDKLPIPRISCVRSSDAHHHNEIVVRNRVTWVRAENKTFGELKAALALPHRITLTYPETTHAHIVGFHVVGSFIADAWIILNEGLNALIGSKGTGKTALLECLRFVLNTPIPKARSEEVQKHRQHILGTGGYVECLVHYADGTHQLITRRMDANDRITIISETGESTSTAASAGQVFPISILGWHEIESVADHATARIEILDRAGEPKIINQAYGKITDLISRARDAFPLLQRQVRKLDNELKELWELQRKRSTLKRLSEGQLSMLQNQYEWFLKAEERLDTIIQSITSRRSQLTEIIPCRIDTTIPTPPDDSYLGELGEALMSMEKFAQASKLAEKSSIGSIDSTLLKISEETLSAKNLLNISFQKFRVDVYAPAVQALPPEDREILSKQIQVLEETKKLPSVEGSCAEQLRELRLLAAQLHSYCEGVCALREEIVATRTALVTALNTELPGIKLQFKQSSNRAARDRFQGRYQLDGASFFGYLDTYAGNDGYEKLRDLFVKLQKLDVDQEKWTIQDQLVDAKFVELLDVIDDDDVDIFLEVGKRGFVPIQSLSAGQRCVAVFPLLLRNTRGPLVIDQPEDNLDNRYIADTIGPDLLNKKLGQQYLVTSHNANLVVLTDADLIIHVDSDGANAEFPAAGFLAWEKSLVKESVLGVLDGGEAALLIRQKKYGIL